MIQIQQSVGAGGVNRPDDVKSVQTLLNQRAGALGIAALAVNGQADAATLTAIRRFQVQVVKLATADGLIDAGGHTWRTLSGQANLSGAAWWQANEGKSPTGTSVDDLEPVFRAKAVAFIAALRAAGAAVKISATLRPKIRVYLMVHSFDIAKGNEKAAAVPPEPGCDIVWDHGDDATSRRAAQEMVDLFGIVFRPDLTSRHLTGRAIDMTITWSGTINVRDGSGKMVALPQPADSTNTTLHAIGSSYKVIKLLKDAPHWSDDGH